MKIAIYAICKNEAKFAERWLRSCIGADYIVVADTGSEDDTVVKLAQLAGELHLPLNLHRISISPWRFDDARNAVLALVPADVDVCIALDIDEVLSPAWREALELAWTPETNSAWINFVFDGKPFAQNNRVHSRYGWRWKHPCHEMLTTNRTERRPVECMGLTITHMPDLTKPRPNYLELLAWGQWEDPTSTRMLFYYGRELYFCGHYADAIERFERYLELEPLQPFPAEREQTIAYLAKCRSSLE
jgi:glycosyltransferase involved in cell wall biosynthesis